MQTCGEFNAKEYFADMYKNYFCPLMKENGFKKISPNCFVRINGEVTQEITLQKSASNTSRGILFWLNITMPGFYGRQDNYLPKERVEYKSSVNQASDYLIFRNENEYDKFLEVLKTDLEEHILPLLSKINSDSIVMQLKDKSSWYLSDSFL
jgi:predicted metal-binding transcription factor (methanogenesis marker protein 9)